MNGPGRGEAGHDINSLIIIMTLFYKIPPYLPLPKGGKTPLFGKEGWGFSDACQFNFETLDKFLSLSHSNDIFAIFTV